jgi:hypothetical protein
LFLKHFFFKKQFAKKKFFAFWDLNDDAMQLLGLARLLSLPKRVRLCCKKCWPIIP